MTSVDDPDELRRILADTEGLLLDFDGPICSVFAGLPAPIVAQHLRDVLSDGGHELPPEVLPAHDPFDVLLYAYTLGAEEARYVEAAFRALEVEAIHTAEPTPGAHDLIQSWKRTGRLLAVVSNNSESAVRTYLDLYNLSRDVDYIAARTGSDTQLKPSPYLVTEAVEALGLSALRCTLIGDAPRDIEAARAANVRAIGYANKPGKVAQLAAALPDAIVSTMAFLLLPVRAD